jgi:hypothetical protein
VKGVNVKKSNAVLNGEWGKHVSRAWKKLTNKKRRAAGKKATRDAG